MTELEQKIKDAAQKYYTDGSSPYTDAEFDAMIDELRSTNPDSALFKTGWGYDINKDSTPGAKVKHKYGRAGSLDKCRTWAQYAGSSMNERHVDASVKLDGISVVLYYENSKLVRALTRGDGEIGIDITDKVTHILPSTTLNTDGFTGAVRGEILMSHSNFEAFAKGHADAKNPRNTTAGLINSKGISDDLAYLSIVVYSIVGYESDKLPESIYTVRIMLDNLFDENQVVPHSELDLNPFNFLEKMEACRNWYGDYPADGIVLTEMLLPDNDGSDYIKYNAKAFKFPAEQGESEVIEVEWNMSKTHYAIPKIHIKPIQLSGTNVEYCTGYHAQYIKENNIGPGTIVKLQKRGEIVPNIDEVVKATTAQMITTCPECGESLIWDGVHLKCANINCGNAILQDTLIYMQKIAPVDGISDTIVNNMLDTLVNLGVIKDKSIESIMECDTELVQTNSVQQNKFSEMWNKLHHDSIDPVNALLAINVPRLGDKTAEKLASHLALMQVIIKEACWDIPMRIDTYNTLVSVVGQANADSIRTHLAKFKRLSYLNILYDNIDVSNAANLKGKVAITGKLSVKRADFEKELKAAGYSVGDITKDTKFLITDDPNSSSSKNAKADKLGVTKITEADFREKFM